jgi:wyosine [tRNA(Phe)-imidazoG37] synthetase (radical SAM superfamily)
MMDSEKMRTFQEEFAEIGTHGLRPSEARPRGLKYRSCGWIEAFSLMFVGRIDTGGRCMALCCEKGDAPGTALCESARDSVENFRRMRTELIAESMRIESLGDADEARKFTASCAKCANFQRGDFGKSDGRIHFVNLSMYPAPCQCKCVYCDIHERKEDKRLNKRLHSAYYEKLFDILSYAESAGYIAPDARWRVASGEITIHPYKDRILEWVKNRAVLFFMNGFLFDEEIASILSANPFAVIHLSIDSGTPETWREVKGVDNFNTVTSNLVKYHACCSKPEQITLKYIVLPGVNNTLADYRSLVEIMKALKVGHLTISRDMRTQYTLDAEARETLISACGILVAIVYKNGMTFDLIFYSLEEREQIVVFAHELLQAGAV